MCLVMTLALGRRAWRRQQRMVMLGWAALLGGLAGLLVLDAGWVRPPVLDATLIGLDGWRVSRLELAGVVIALWIGAFLLWQVWSRPVARWCVVIALLIGLTNPMTEAVENHLISDGWNYQYIANDQPYRFRDGPSIQLHQIQTIQEISEMLSILLLALALGLVVLRPVPDPPAGSVVALPTLASGD